MKARLTFEGSLTTWGDFKIGLHTFTKSLADLGKLERLDDGPFQPGDLVECTQGHACLTRGKRVEPGSPLSGEVKRGGELRADWPWYWSHDQEVWMEAGSREDAIYQGSECLDAGEAFEIAQCTPKGPWPTLFADAGELCEFIDEQNEDNAFEEGFTAEAGLSTADVEPLADAINALWAAFLEQHKPRSRGLHSGPAETITIAGSEDDQSAPSKTADGIAASAAK